MQGCSALPLVVSGLMIPGFELSCLVSLLSGCGSKTQ